MRDQEATGKHARSTEGRSRGKETETSNRSEEQQPKSHSSRQSHSTSARQEGRQQEEPVKTEQSKDQDMKAREYRDAEGNIHHHTHTSREMKENEGKESKKDKAA